MFFCNEKNTIRIGIDTTIDAAAKTDQLPLISVACREYNPAANVYVSEPVMKFTAKIYSFHTYTNTLIAVTAIVGFAKVNTIRRTICV